MLRCRLQAAVAHRTHIAPTGLLEPESSISPRGHPSTSFGMGFLTSLSESGTPLPLQQRGAGQQGPSWSGMQSCPHRLCPTSRARQGRVPAGGGVRMAGGVNEPGCAVCAALLEFCSETPWETQSMYYLRWLLEADANVSLLRSPKYPVLLWCVACVCSVYVSISHANKRLLSPFVLCSLIMRTLQPLSVVLPLQMLTVELR